MDMEIEIATTSKFFYGQEIEDDDPSFLRWILNDFENDHPSSICSSPPPLYFNPTLPEIPSLSSTRVAQIQHQKQQHELCMNEEEEEEKEEEVLVMEELFRAAEMVEKGDSQMAEGILARLNNHLSPLGNPFHRAAFSLKQTLQHLLLLLIFQREEDNNNTISSTLPHILCAYKSFSEISPVLQFANFTSIQSLLEQLHGHPKIHLLDFDIGFGWHWASFMQELSLRNNSSLKITAVVYPTVQGRVELGLVKHNLTQFAQELQLEFELEIVNSEESLHLLAGVRRGEAMGVNIPMDCSLMCQLPPLQLLLRMMKQVSVKVIVCMERGGGGDGEEEMSFSENVMCSFKWYRAMLESVEAVGGRGDVVQKIERFILEKEVERRVFGYWMRLREKRIPWRKLFISFGFSPLTFSNFCESQAELLVKRSVAPLFMVERRRLSLVLCWRRKELVSVSAWRC